MQFVEQNFGLYNLSDFLNTDLDVRDRHAAAIIGPEGGLVAVTDPASPIFGTSLTVPKGALDAPVKISIMMGDHSCDFGMGPSLKLLPNGLVFKRPATLAVHLHDNMTEEADFEETMPAFYQYDESIDQWTRNDTARLVQLDSALLCKLNHL